MKTPHITKSRIPRCPFCGVVLEYSIDVDTRMKDRLAILTLKPLSRTHVLKAHTLDFPEDDA